MSLREGRRWLIGCLVLTWLLAAWIYRETLASIVDKWNSDAAFSHGVLIVPIAAWLAWRKRRTLAGIDFAPSWGGAGLLLLTVAIWVIARASGVLVLEQFAFVAMLPALLFAILGRGAATELVFPLGFLFFMVPFGRGVVPLLMQQTAAVSTMGLEWTGVPVLRDDMYITIPGGGFEVARACSGLNFFLTGLVLGALYAHVTYRSAWKRALCMAAFVLVPVFFNGVRVYLTILISHLTDMRYGPGAEHITVGRVFVVSVLVLLMWTGRRWADADTEISAAPTPRSDRPGASLGAGSWAVPIAALLLIAAGPPGYSWALERTRASVGPMETLARLPAGISGWDGPQPSEVGWRPQYSGGLVEKRAAYLDHAGNPVVVFVAVYGLGAALGGEMISYGNVISQDEFGSLKRKERRAIGLQGGGELEFKELTVDDAGRRLRVWYWYQVGDRRVTSPFVAKGWEIARFLAARGGTERVIVLATADDDEAERRLASFVESHSACVGAGFTAEACAG